MRLAYAFSLFLLLGLSGVAQADSRRDLNDCMVGDYQASIQACTRLLDSNAAGINTASLHVLRGYAYKQSGKISEAMADFDKAIGLAPNSADAYSLRGAIHYKMGHTDLAAADVGRSTALMKAPPRDALQNFCNGLYFQDLGMGTFSLNEYDLALKADPNLAAVYVKRSEVQLADQSFDKALASLDKAIQLDPQFSAALFLRGIVRERKGDKPGAIADYRQAVAINPSLSAGKAAIQRLEGQPVSGQSLRDQIKGALTPPNANWGGDGNYTGDYRLLAMHVQKQGRPVGVAVNYYEMAQTAKEFLEKLRADAVAAPVYQGADIKTVIPMTVKEKEWWLFRITGKDGGVQDVWARNLNNNVILDIMYTAGSQADFDQYRNDAMTIITQASAF